MVTSLRGLRQHQVHEDDVRRPRRQGRQRLDPVTGFAHLESDGTQQFPQDVTVVRLVVDDQRTTLPAAIAADA